MPRDRTYHFDRGGNPQVSCFSTTSCSRKFKIPFFLFLAIGGHRKWYVQIFVAPPELFGNQCRWIQGIVGVNGSCDVPLCNHIFLSDWEGQIVDLEEEAILLFPCMEKDIMSPLIIVNPCIQGELDLDFIISSHFVLSTPKRDTVILILQMRD